MAHADKIGVKVYVSDFGAVKIPDDILRVYEIYSPPVKPKRKHSKKQWKAYRRQRKSYKWHLKLFERNMEAICCHNWMMGRDMEIY